jgi:hypothetical protein
VKEEVMQQVLEALRRAAASLMNPGHRFVFTDWTACTCGHIYIGAVGRQAPRAEVIDSSSSVLYRDTMFATARALGWEPVDPMSMTEATQFVSDYTTSAAASELTGSVTYEHALKVVNEAIAKIEAAEEEARRAVLTTAQSIVDAAVTEAAAPEPATV